MIAALTSTMRTSRARQRVRARLSSEFSTVRYACLRLLVGERTVMRTATRCGLIVLLGLLAFLQSGCFITAAVRENHLRADSPQKELCDQPAAATATYLGAYQDQWIIRATGLLRADRSRPLFVIIPFKGDRPITITDRVEFEAHAQDPSVHVEFTSTTPEQAASFEYPYAVYLSPGDNTAAFNAMINDIGADHQPRKLQWRTCEYDLERQVRSTAAARLRPLEYGLSVPADIALTPIYVVFVPIMVVVLLSGGVCG
jgi:hypothetical protein